MKVDLWGLFGDPHGANEDIKDMKTGSVSEKRNGLASEKGHIKHTEQYQAPRGIDNSRREIRRWNGYADW